MVYLFFKIQYSHHHYFVPRAKNRYSMVQSTSFCLNYHNMPFFKFNPLFYQNVFMQVPIKSGPVRTILGKIRLTRHPNPSLPCTMSIKLSLIYQDFIIHSITVIINIKKKFTIIQSCFDVNYCVFCRCSISTVTYTSQLDLFKNYLFLFSKIKNYNRYIKNFYLRNTHW